jgi:hypothetical protein
MRTHVLTCEQPCHENEVPRISYFENDMTVLRGEENLDSFKIRDDALSTRLFCKLCHTHLLVDNPFYAGNCTAVYPEVCHLSPSAEQLFTRIPPSIIYCTSDWPTDKGPLPDYKLRSETQFKCHFIKDAEGNVIPDPDLLAVVVPKFSVPINNGGPIKGDTTVQELIAKHGGAPSAGLEHQTPSLLRFKMG